MYGVLHPKSDIDRLYLKRKHGGGLALKFVQGWRKMIWVGTCVDRMKCFSKA